MVPDRGYSGQCQAVHFSICTIAVRGIQKLYVQTKDPDTGVAYNAVCIGDWLGTTRPQCMVDGKANVHVFSQLPPC